ncbi:MAG: SsrA-binding protein SmpB [Oscillospiraceae bacterium]|jgi:SsrA-binding protein|nr:SsrA-binding protein SmpB [Oscillospiraceae bacterium]
MSGVRIVAQNRKALHDYFVLETLEVGVELKGTEVKSVRAGRLNLRDAWCSISKGELFMNGVHISPYSHGNIFNQDPIRMRRLLAHKKETSRLMGQVKKSGISIIPLSVYFKRSYIKIKIGLCKGKKNYDKRAQIAQRESQRDIQRTLKESRNLKF